MATGDVQIIDISSGPFEKSNCSTPKTAFLKNLADRGIRTVIRYYSDENNLPCKNITPGERDLLHDYGFSVAIVYQFNGRAPGRYNKASGVKDSAFCLKRAAEIKQPEGSAIYFGIDADASTHDSSGVIDYLTEVNKAFKNKFRIGCYGPGTICEAALEKNLVSFTWVPEAPAWKGTQKFMNSGKWTFYQNKTDMTKSELCKGHGIEIDTDIVNVNFDTIGAFAKDGSIVRYEMNELKNIIDARRWVKELEAPLFDRPGGSRVGHMCIARTVRVVADMGNGWVGLDINEDGKAEGCCEARLLAPFSQMPAWRSGCSPMPL